MKAKRGSTGRTLRVIAKTDQADINAYRALHSKKKNNRRLKMWIQESAETTAMVEARHPKGP